VTPSGSGREGGSVGAPDDGAGGEEVKQSDDSGSWSSDVKISSSDANERLDWVILRSGRSTDGDGEEGGLEKEHRAIFDGLRGK